MPFGLRGPELLILLVIILLLFGVGRISKIAGEMGSSIREFRKGLGSDKNKEEAGTEQEKKDE